MIPYEHYFYFVIFLHHWDILFYLYIGGICLSGIYFSVHFSLVCGSFIYFKRPS